MKAIRRVLVANRGEIAVRVIRAVREAGLESVAVFSDADAGALHVRAADRRVGLGSSSAKESYLNKEKLVNAAVSSGADAIHPGYGFLAENAEFAALVRGAGLVFIGPSPEVILLMGDKDRARKKAIEVGVPVVPGLEAGTSVEGIKKFASEIGYPVIVKAVAGGSGRGMRLVECADELEAKIAEASKEAEGAFGNGVVFVEKYVARPRHIEIQVFGDCYGNAVHFGERECSLQRRHQKIVEESPAPRFHSGLRKRMLDAALLLTKSVGYEGAGTLEFLVEGGEAEESPFYFLEMNTRIQVEHTVTEEVMGVDLVRLQLEVAAGATLREELSKLEPRGHAFQFRVYAENPSEGFKPQTGRVAYMSRNGGPGVREDGWAEAGTKISAFYDSLLSKIVVWGETRDAAIARSRRVLQECVVEGIANTLPFHRWLVQQEAFLRGDLYVRWIDEFYRGEMEGPRSVGPLVLPPLVEQGTQ